MEGWRHHDLIKIQRGLRVMFRVDKCSLPLPIKATTRYSMFAQKANQFAADTDTSPSASQR